LFKEPNYKINTNTNSELTIFCLLHHLIKWFVSFNLFTSLIWFVWLIYLFSNNNKSSC
jgi:hypothetical protein